MFSTSVAYHSIKSDFFSGAHINPAVTLGVTLAGGLQPIMAIPYVLSQLMGAIIGAGIVRVCHLQFSRIYYLNFSKFQN